MNVPIMTHNLALQIERSKGDYLESWVQGMREYPGNPFGADMVWMNNVRVLAASHLQEVGLFNTVIGLGSQDKELLPDIVRFYHDNGIEHYHLEINPYQVTSEFLAALAVNGFSLSAFQTYIYGVPALNPPMHPFSDITVHDVTPPELDLFADLHVEGFQEALSRLPESTRMLYRESVKVLYQLSGWHLYLVRINMTSSGMGMLYIQNGLAFLGGGATLPHMRMKGGQTASLRHRLIVAAQAQCSLFSGQTRVGSRSQHNMKRIGMQIAYNGTFWKRYS